MILASQVVTTPIYRAEKLVRNHPYRRFLKSFPCMLCGATWNIGPCHIRSHGKSPEMRCILLCRKCHDQFDGGSKRFGLLHLVNIIALRLLLELKQMSTTL